MRPDEVNPRVLADRLAELAAAHDDWRGRTTLNLNAANNVLSPAARRMLATRLADKGISGGLGRRHHMGGGFIDELEHLVLDLARRAFDAPHVEYRPASGSLANALAIAALTDADDTLMVLGDAAPGHQSYRRDGWGGRLARRVVDLPFDPERLDVDLPALERELTRTRPRLLILGTALFIFAYDLEPIRRAADRVGASIMYDAAHPLGLIAGGVWPNPFDAGVDLLTGSTQKSLFGPIGGVIATRSRPVGDRLFDKTTTLISNYENNRVATLGVALAELVAFGAAYATACVRNARALAAALADRGFAPLGAARGYTCSNQVLLRVSGDVSADALVERWEAASIIATAMGLPRPTDAAADVADGVRLGVQELTRLGMGVADMARVGELMARAARDDPAVVGQDVQRLVRSFPTVYYCFDNPAPGRVTPSPGGGPRPREQRARDQT